jgi:hypothetical protein
MHASWSLDVASATFGLAAAPALYAALQFVRQRNRASADNSPRDLKVINRADIQL